MTAKTIQKNTKYNQFNSAENLKTEFYDFIDGFIKEMEASTHISLTGWLYPNLYNTFYDMLNKTGYAGWSYSFDFPDCRQTFCIHAELDYHKKEQTYKDTSKIVSLPDSLPGYFIGGENPADFFDLTSYFILQNNHLKNIKPKPIKENTDALIFQFSYPDKNFTQGDIIDLYKMYFGSEISDIEELKIVEWEFLVLRNSNIISKIMQKKQENEPDSYHLIAPQKLFDRIKNNMSDLSSELT